MAFPSPGSLLARFLLLILFNYGTFQQVFRKQLFDLKVTHLVMAAFSTHNSSRLETEQKVIKSGSKRRNSRRSNLRLSESGSHNLRRTNWQKLATPWILLFPFIFMVLVALGYPLIRQVLLSLQNFGLKQQFGEPADWVGLRNYQQILSSTEFWTVFFKSIGFCLWTASLTMVIGVGVAILMLRLHPLIRGFLSTTMVVVWAMPALASLTIWQWLIDPRSGLLNYVLTSFGLKFHNFNWLHHHYLTFYAIASALIIWQSLPLVAITIHAALAQVPKDMLEAAQIDGASQWQQISRIMLPTITPVIALISVLQIIWDIRVFTQIYVLQQAGGLASETNLLGTYVYQIGIGKGNYGLASALAMIILLLTLLLTARYLRMLYRQGGMD